MRTKPSVTIKAVMKDVLFFGLCVIGMLAFFVIAGEDNPNMPMSLGTFFLLKLCATVVLCGVIGAGLWLQRVGVLPKVDDLLVVQWAEYYVPGLLTEPKDGDEEDLYCGGE